MQTDLRACLTAPIAVAIPVRNEEVLISACIKALGTQSCAPVFDLVLLVNNTTDRSVEAARHAAAGLPLRLTILEHEFPLAEQTAGHARRLAMQAAAGLCGPGSILMCTDADGRAAPDWIAANLSEMRGGADAVAGRALLDPADAASIPAALHEADARECAYAAVLDSIASLVDPDPADPWPRHTEHSGASICVTWAAWNRAGGVPAVSLGEDRAFFQALRRIDARIRHAPDACVTVSGRIAGRAAGGMADTIRRRMEITDPFVDDALEPALDRLRRLRLRERLRHARANARLLPDLARALEISLDHLAAAAAAPTFGIAWETLERECPSLAQRPVPTAGLEVELARAERILEGLLRAGAPSEVLEAAD
ncbi:MAG TPA: glycosyltransferase family A protein [Acetobacteraceae bacterium]